jgi:hypothetical protein
MPGRAADVNVGTFGLVMGVIGFVFLLALIAIGVFGILRTSGQTRVLVGAGVGALVLSRLLGMLPGLVSSIGGGGLFFSMQIVMGVITTLLTLAGIGLLVWAAIPRADVGSSHGSAPQGPAAWNAPPGGWQ